MTGPPILAAAALQSVAPNARFFPVCHRDEWGLCVELDTRDSASADPATIAHEFPAPLSALQSYNACVDWIFDCYCSVLIHKAGEVFANAGEHPFRPPHAPGTDWYDVRRKPAMPAGTPPG